MKNLAGPLLMLLVACATPTRASATQGVPGTRHPSPSYHQPEGAIAWTCVVRPTLDVTLENGGRDLHLRFALESADGRTHTVTLNGGCPQPLVALQGLPPGFDPMHGCQRGACVHPVAKTQLNVPAQGSVFLGETVLRSAGDSCNPPLPDRPLGLSPTISGDGPGAIFCAGPSQRIERDPATGTLRLVVPPTPTRTRPEPKPSPPAIPKKPEPAPTRTRPCPICAFGCPSGIPATGTGPDGCPRCGCEDLKGTLGTKPGK